MTAPAQGADGGIPLHNLLGFEVHPEADGPISRVSMPVRAESFGVNDNLHGGALATLVDLASALAAVRTRVIDLEVESLVTADIHIRYLGQPRTDSVTASAQVVRDGRQMIVIECKIHDGGGHLISSADVGMMVVPRRRPLPS
ncbi:PaaI family thioesterase [Aquihabitans sp. McL0605]|uniref:PaaI family thioesterase n=1 Tax=Aquihabitans sp. McL0605 TaxID=3415671 RepID=UPI003CEC5751